VNGIVAFGPRKRLPRLTPFGLALVLALALGLVFACGVTLVRAQEAAEDVPRYEPVSRGPRAAVDLIEAAFPADWAPWAVRTARCESGLDPYAYSAGFDRRWGVFYEHVGALQVDGVTWRRVAVGDFREPAVNLAVAAYVLTVQGTGAWPYCGRTW
jgi:hypothetical protein